jgi:DNA-binding transcriptional MerR regulator/DNA-binding NarL/FixJ family response regulator
MNALSNQPSYRSGVAARLAGIPVDTLRIWERRYAIVAPTLSSGRQRLYCQQDIHRLGLIKQLVDLGHPVGSLARLDQATLIELRGNTLAMMPTGDSSPSATPAEQTPATELRVALVGPLLIPQRIEQAVTAVPLQIVGRCADPASAADQLQGCQADLLIIELPALDQQSVLLVNTIRVSCRARQVIVLYRYAPSEPIRQLRLAGHAVARASGDASEIEAICVGLMQRAQRASANSTAAGAAAGASDQRNLARQAPPPARFDAPTLARFASQSRTVDCECPRHLADLVLNLSSFEQYSAQCASRSPADAALHRELEHAAGHARALIEQALEKVVVAEGLLDAGTSATSTSATSKPATIKSAGHKSAGKGRSAQRSSAARSSRRRS